MITLQRRAVYDDGVLVGRVQRVGQPWQAWLLVGERFTFVGWASTRADAVRMVVGDEPRGHHRFEAS